MSSKSQEGGIQGRVPGNTGQKAGFLCLKKNETDGDKPGRRASQQWWGRNIVHQTLSPQ